MNKKNLRVPTCLEEDDGGEFDLYLFEQVSRRLLERFGEWALEDAIQGIIEKRLKDIES